jgi:serine/threonine-protein kinase
MLTEAEKRAAKLAVSRYGADRERVQRVFHAVSRALARGERANLLEGLVVEQLLTASQAEELRLALDATHPDINRPHQAPAAANGTPRADGLPAHVRSLAGFRILRKLGEGGMGAVYLAYQEDGHRQVAVKVLAEALASSKAYLDRFYREARSGALLSHVNIVRNLDAGRDEATGLHYLVLEYVDGPSARELLDRHGRLAVPDAVHIALDIARALEHAHSRNVVHRDIKPDNILLTRSGLAKLADLGLAKRTDEASHLTAARQGFGTPYYMPYEQAWNARHADGRSDIYALGATLYHLLTGEVPFPGDSHVEIMHKKDGGYFVPAGDVNPDVPPALDQLLDKMMARDPGDRYQTASELIIDLERCGLAPAMPSFADPDLALQDPVVRQRLAEQAMPTSLDVRVGPGARQAEEPPAPDLWFVRYRRQGQWCKGRATTEQILKRLRKGRLGADTEAARDLAEPFRPLAVYAEFRAAASPAPPPGASKPQEDGPNASGGDSPRRPDGTAVWLVLGGGLVVSLLALVGLVLYKLFVEA